MNFTPVDGPLMTSDDPIRYFTTNSNPSVRFIMRMINDDNVYPENSAIRAKAAPETPLIIIKYLHQIYYCAPASAPTGKQLAHFERELLPPASV